MSFKKLLNAIRKNRNRAVHYDFLNEASVAGATLKGLKEFSELMSMLDLIGVDIITEYSVPDMAIESDSTKKKDYHRPGYVAPKRDRMNMAKTLRNFQLSKEAVKSLEECEKDVAES